MRATTWREPLWHRFVRLNADAIGNVVGGGFFGALFVLMAWWLA